jgi:hypothetical protein
MAFLTITSNKHKAINIEVMTIRTENFRVVCPLIDNKMFLVTENLMGMIIDDLSFKELIRIDRENEHTTKCGSFYNCLIRCNTCHGSGIINWVDNIFNKFTPSHRSDYHQYKFIRNEYAVFYQGHYNFYGRKYPALLSIPKLPEAFEYCNKCFGTGISVHNHDLKIWRYKEEEDYKPESPFLEIDYLNFKLYKL